MLENQVFLASKQDRANDRNRGAIQGFGCERRQEMDSRQKICHSKCEECPFASCNFNPSFVTLLIMKEKEEAAYSSHENFAWVGVESAYANLRGK
jgi:hypothetical protein